MTSPFAIMLQDDEFIHDAERENRSDYVLREIDIVHKLSCTKSLDSRFNHIEHTDSIMLLKQKKHHLNNIGLLHITKGPKNIDRIKGFKNVRFFYEGNIYYPTD